MSWVILVEAEFLQTDVKCTSLLAFCYSMGVCFLHVSSWTETDIVTYSLFPSSVNDLLRHTHNMAIFLLYLCTLPCICFWAQPVGWITEWGEKSHTEMLHGGFIALMCCLIMSFKQVCCQFSVMVFEVQSQFKCRSVGRYQGSLWSLTGSSKHVYQDPDIKPSNSPLVLVDLLPSVPSLLGHPVAPEVPE